MGNKAITADHLVKYYGKARGIDGLNLEVETGDFFGFIGPNGAGKSTTIRTLLGLISPTSGKAQVLGMDIGKNNRAILQRVGYLPSDTAFYNGMKVREILKLSADLRKKDCSKAADELCERLQLDRDRKVEDLSFGNRKKVGIVCALQHDPELLVLDEPTGGLDPLMQHEFFNSFPAISCLRSSATAPGPRSSAKEKSSPATAWINWRKAVPAASPCVETSSGKTCRSAGTGRSSATPSASFTAVISTL